MAEAAATLAPDQSDCDQHMDNFKANADKLLECGDKISEEFSDLGITTNFTKYSEFVNQVLIKNANSTLDIVFIGKTSSGKSMIINCLLGIDVMMSSIGHTTPSVVRIQTTKESNSYYKYSNEEERHEIDLKDRKSLKKFHDIVDGSSQSGLHTDQCIEVYISKDVLKQNCIISEKVSILDTPGMERDVFQKDEVKKRIHDADAMILVVDIVTWSDNSAIRKLLNDDNYFVTPNLIVAINKCDVLLEEKPDKQEIHKKNVKKELLGLNAFNGRTNDEIDASTSFISAKLTPKLKTRKFWRYTTNNDKRLLINAFRKLEENIISTAQKNSVDKKNKRIDEAIERCMKELKEECDRIAEKAKGVKGVIRNLNNHIKESTSKVIEIKDHQFIKTVYIEDLHELKSGREKIKSFLDHCKEKGFDDIKKTLIRESVSEEIATFIDKVLREEIGQIGKIYDEDVFHRIEEILDPFDSNGVSCQLDLSEVNRTLAEIERDIEKLLIETQRELKENYEVLFNDIKEKQKVQQELIDKILEDTSKRHIPFGIQIPSSAAEVMTLGFQLHQIVNSPSFITPTAANLSPPALLRLAAVSVVGVGMLAVGWYCFDKKKANDEHVHELKQEISDDSKRLSDYKETQKKASDICQRNQESERNILKDAKREERRKFEEREQRYKKYKENHRAALNELFGLVIRTVSRRLEMRLNNTVDSLDFLGKEGAPDENQMREVWQWASNSVKAMQNN